jgi:hypothetical protein
VVHILITFPSCCPQDMKSLTTAKTWRGYLPVSVVVAVIVCMLTLLASPASAECTYQGQGGCVMVLSLTYASAAQCLVAFNSAYQPPSYIPTSAALDCSGNCYVQMKGYTCSSLTMANPPPVCSSTVTANGDNVPCVLPPSPGTRSLNRKASLSPRSLLIGILRHPDCMCLDFAGGSFTYLRC